MTPRCACGQPAPDATICHTCTRDLGHALEDIPALAAELDITLASAYARRTGHILATLYTHTPPLPYDERASNADAELHAALAKWVKRLGGQPDGLAPMARWLLGNLDALRQHPLAAEAVYDIPHAAGRGTRVIDRPAPRVYAGPCDCGTDLLSKPGRTLVSCPACGDTYGIAERLEWMRTRLEDHLGTAAYAAAILPGIGIHVTSGTIRMWASRGRLASHPGIPRPSGVPGPPTYRLGDVIGLALARDTARLGVRDLCQ